MANKGIAKIPLFDPFSQKMSCPLFGVPTVFPGFLADFDIYFTYDVINMLKLRNEVMFPRQKKSAAGKILLSPISKTRKRLI